MPWRTVTSARLQPWQPPSSWMRTALVDLDQGHPTAVSRDHRVDLRIQDIANPVGEALAATRRWRFHGG